MAVVESDLTTAFAPRRAALSLAVVVLVNLFVDLFAVDPAENRELWWKAIAFGVLASQPFLVAAGAVLFPFGRIRQAWCSVALGLVGFMATSSNRAAFFHDYLDFACAMVVQLEVLLAILGTLRGVAGWRMVIHGQPCGSRHFGRSSRCASCFS